jgi:membrane protein required for colicin V production
MQSLHWLDYAILGVIVLSVLTGCIRGFFKELISLSIWIIAGWLSFLYAKPVAMWLSTYIHDATIRIASSYVIIVVSTLIAGGLCSSIISFIMHRTGLSGTDRLLGFGFGIVRGVFIVALFMVVLRVTGMPVDDYQEKSLFYKHFEPIVNWMYQYVPDMIKHVDSLEQKNTAQLQSKAGIIMREFETL